MNIAFLIIRFRIFRVNSLNAILNERQYKFDYKFRINTIFVIKFVDY